MRVAVVGGGLAGITAALRLADAGAHVTLFEASPRLGGLTASFMRGDLEVDTGQHVFMRCCTAYRSLLDRLGVTNRTMLQPRLSLPVVRTTDGRHSRIFRDPLPVVAGMPGHLGRSLAGYSLLSPRERLAVARAALALRDVDSSGPATDTHSFGDWLDEHGQSESARASLWDLVGVATLNARADEASLSLAAIVFQLGLLSDPGAADLGWSNVPLGELHGDAADNALRRAGATVACRQRVTALMKRATGWSVATAIDEYDVDAVVLAADPIRTEALLPAASIDQPDGWSERLGRSPIVNVHVVLDRKVMAEPLLACVGSPLQWIFDRTRPSRLPNGQYLAASISAADAVSNHTVAAIRDALLPEFERAVPAMRTANVTDFFVTREPAATFRQAPGSAQFRPTTRTRHAGLVLAGAHTATGWPATMEGAVRSGDAAAAAILADARIRRSEEVAA